MDVVYAHELAPRTYRESLFLAGPTPRTIDVVSWRPEALRILRDYDYDGVVFVPEPRDGDWRREYIAQIEWEEKYLHMADCILFWIPRDMQTLPALTTNDEWGFWKRSGKVVLGVPEGTPHTNYQKHYASKFGVPQADTLAGTIRAAMIMIGDGALRTDGEREVPLYIWRTAHFQQWYAAQRNAGNRLDGVRVEWTFRVGPGGSFVLFWVLHANVYVTSEARHKSNEVVISRPSISVVVMYQQRVPVNDSPVVLIREFRSPAVTTDGFVMEVPGGSSFKPNADMHAVMAQECEQETGLVVDPKRVAYHGVRQLMATVSSHQAYVFSCPIDNNELTALRQEYLSGVSHGDISETERTYVVVSTLGEVKRNPNIDWSMQGIIRSVLED